MKTLASALGALFFMFPMPVATQLIDRPLNNSDCEIIARNSPADGVECFERVRMQKRRQLENEVERGKHLEAERVVKRYNEIDQLTYEINQETLVVRKTLEQISANMEKNAIDPKLDDELHSLMKSIKQKADKLIEKIPKKK